MEAITHPLGKWRLRQLPCSFVTFSDGHGRGALGTMPAVLYLPGPRPQCEFLFRHAERVNRFYYVPLS